MCGSAERTSRMIEEELKIWAAGLFDGEGSALIERTGSNRQSYQITVAVASTDSRNTDPIMEAWGGHYRKTRNLNKWKKEGSATRRLDCSVYFDRQEAKGFLIDILPYLRAKHEETALIIRAIMAQEKRIKEKGIRNSTLVLAPYYIRLQSIRNR